MRHTQTYIHTHTNIWTQPVIVQDVFHLYIPFRSSHPETTTIKSKRKLSQVITHHVRKCEDVALMDVIRGIPCMYAQHLLSSKFSIGKPEKIYNTVGV